MNGITAAGCIATADAGSFAIKNGGNAVDALISAQLCACVSEPLLTGIMSAGLATIKMNGKIEVLDFFTTLPQNTNRTKPRLVPIKFGTVNQNFSIGWGSVSVPGLPRGLAAIHEKYASLPLKLLAQPAIDASRNGVPITPGMAKVLELLFPIYKSNRHLLAMFTSNDRPLKAGDIYYNETAEQDLLAYLNCPTDFLVKNHYGDLLEKAPSELSLCKYDCANYKPIWRKPITVEFHGTKLHMAPPPSTCGLMIQHALKNLANPPPYTKSTCIKALLSIANVERTQFDKNAFNYGAGFTTHISTADKDGNVAAITTSLGESAGELLPGTGLVLNNFLGEEDVYPSSLQNIINTGNRLITMCCPTIVETMSTTTAMGAGGSSRIRSAIFHGIHQSILNKSCDQIVYSPRVHCEGNDIYVESFEMNDDEKLSLDSKFNTVTYFDEHGIFFGGLNLSRFDKVSMELSGASDPRRSGEISMV